MTVVDRDEYGAFFGWQGVSGRDLRREPEL
jgi:hypothetical protein